MKIHSILPVKDANLPEFLRQKLASLDNGGPLNSVMTLDETVPPGNDQVHLGLGACWL